MRLDRSLRIAARYLIGYSRRYVFLLVALGFGFGVITVMTSLRDGMTENVARAAENHYSGHLFVLGFDKQADTTGVVDDDELVMEAIEAARLEPSRFVRRTTSHLKGVLFFQGTAVRHKDIFGVDFDNEAGLFEEMAYASGGFALPMQDDALIISSPVATELGARVGDRVTVQVPTRNRQINTGDFRVAAIVNDQSIFGYYTAYVPRSSLNRLLGLESDAYSALGLYFDARDNVEERAAVLYEQLSRRLPMSPPVLQKEDLTLYLSQEWDGVRYFTFPLSVYVSEVSDLLRAMTLGSYLLYTMILLVVLSGALVTYRLVIQERAQEIAAMRALGMYRADVRRVLILEALLVFSLAAVTGVLLAIGINAILGAFSYDWIPGFEIFLRQGRLRPTYSATTTGINIAVFAAVLLPLVAFHAGIAARAGIAQVLSGGTQ